MRKRYAATLIAAGSMIGGAGSALATKSFDGGRGGIARVQDATPIVEGEYPFTTQLIVPFNTENSMRSVALPVLPENTDRVLVELSAVADLPIIGSSSPQVVFLAMLGGARVRQVDGFSPGGVRLNAGGHDGYPVGHVAPGRPRANGSIEIPAWDVEARIQITCDDSIGLLSAGGEIEGSWILTATVTPIDLD